MFANSREVLTGIAEDYLELNIRNYIECRDFTRTILIGLRKSPDYNI